MLRTLAVFLVSVLCAASLAACSEKPARLVPDGEQAYNGDHGENPLRERTLKQGESGRMSY
jgi:hypothetical protein